MPGVKSEEWTKEKVSLVKTALLGKEGEAGNLAVSIGLAARSLGVGRTEKGTPLSPPLHRLLVYLVGTL